MLPVVNDIKTLWKITKILFSPKTDTMWPGSSFFIFPATF